ncbi:Neuronal acetylcholine receptor subunit alpha-9-I [Pseudolycoriella hygida]|uniref:Neuronal acetylcholine receptor subunit alpha-9-I n=1 Tax=Pseudolycoriella hygida TaxID=35572 RepID=A0A9Q0MPZ2_9DIPT|nr:Neuronal acetylcholine receptor subunit alpha-9-I [Pseudolycoriella hygida]
MAQPMKLLSSTCEIDVTWFPFDEQKCSLVFGSWIYDSKDLYMGLNDGVGYWNELTKSDQWKLLGIVAEKTLLIDIYIPEDSYSRIKYTIHIKRRSFYYFFNLIIPCGLIGFLAVLDLPYRQNRMKNCHSALQFYSHLLYS